MKKGKEYWRSLQEYSESGEFKAFLEREFPQGASFWDQGMDRREFLKLLGASMALAGLGSCARPAEEILPYIQGPDQDLEGRPVFYATAMTLGGYGKGMLVKNQAGRPIKVEGNPDHPASLGATDVFQQASLLELYDPHRSKAPLFKGDISTWDQFFEASGKLYSSFRKKLGEGLFILTETLTSPSLIQQIRRLSRTFPKAAWLQYEPFHRGHMYLGAQMVYGEKLEALYRFDRARVVVALDSDFFFRSPGNVPYARALVEQRKNSIREKQRTMNRLYVVESTPSITGAYADERWPLKSWEVEFFARALARYLGVDLPHTPQALHLEDHPWIRLLGEDLKRHRGRGLVLAGEDQPPVVHAITYLINEKLGNVGSTLQFIDPVVEYPENQDLTVPALARAMNQGAVEVLIILGGNPVYNALADLDFGKALSRVPLSIRLGLYEDETSERCTWHLPQAHFLESWGDVRSFDGTASIVQPLIAPLYNGISPHEFLGGLEGPREKTAYDFVREYWVEQSGHKDDFENFWRECLHQGIVPQTTFVPRTPPSISGKALPPPSSLPATKAGELEVVFRPDYGIWDGRFAGNGWLQEVPRPLTKLTWDNVAMISPKEAQERLLQNGDMVSLEWEGRKISAPIWVMPGHVDGGVTLTLGYGRKKAGPVGEGVGFHAGLLRTSRHAFFGVGGKIKKLNKTYPLASTQVHHSLEGRDLVRTQAFEQYLQEPFPKTQAKPFSLYPDFSSKGEAWAMVIDQSACIGCNACVVACQAENNIPVVGKDQVRKGREMHWLRIDLYHRGSPGNPAMFFQPLPCMHCEKAPCEVVCPVMATSHSDDGLNEMTYNRCIGTRYCSNNCPYKVRRFNFFQYADLESAEMKLVRNPEVTVRTRGVMEKCTFCVQRISAARIEAKMENRPIADGEVMTACQAACPTRTISFGDMNDERSQVSAWKSHPLNYGLLEELGTRPRTTYLTCIKNPNPAIQKPEPLGERHDGSH